MAVPQREMTPRTRAMHADTFNVPLVIQLTDDEKFLWKDMKVAWLLCPLVSVSARARYLHALFDHEWVRPAQRSSV